MVYRLILSNQAYNKLFNHKVILISLFFMILNSTNDIKLPLFVLNKANIALLNRFYDFIV